MAPFAKNSHLVAPAVDRFNYNLVRLRRELEESRIEVESFSAVVDTLTEKSYRDAVKIEDLFNQVNEMQM